MQMTDRQKKIWGIATVIGLVVFMGLLCWFVGRPMIRFVSEPEKFRLWVDEHGIWGRLAFIGMVISRSSWPLFLESLWRSAQGMPLARWRAPFCA